MHGAASAMFTGLIADLGEVDRAATTTARARRSRSRTRLAGELGEGDSIAVNGVCLTATEVGDGSFAAQAMRETLERSALGALRGRRAGEPRAGAARRRSPGRARRPGPRRRHGTVGAIREEGFSRVLRIDEREPGLARYLVEKGSVARERRQPDGQRAARATVSRSR